MRKALLAIALLLIPACNSTSEPKAPQRKSVKDFLDSAQVSSKDGVFLAQTTSVKDGVTFGLRVIGDAQGASRSFIATSNGARAIQRCEGSSPTGLECERDAFGGRGDPVAAPLAESEWKQIREDGLTIDIVAVKGTTSVDVPWEMAHAIDELFENWSRNQ